MNIAAEIAELHRLINNLIRTGTVTEVDLDSWTCRVKTGELETNFLPWSTPRAGDARLWWPPSVGEQVMIFSLSGNLETAIVAPALFSDGNPPPGLQAKTLTIQFSDDAVIQYDANSGALAATGMKTAQIEAAESITAETKQVIAKATVKITLETPTVECSNHLTAKTLSITEGGTMKGNITHSGGKLSSNGVVVDDHDHGGVERGGGRTDGPR
ncbi:phage baseplate assembly protein V [Serratia fonticola]